MRFFFQRFHMLLSLGKYFQAKSEHFIIYLFILKYLFIYLAALSHSFITRDLHCVMQDLS